MNLTLENVNAVFEDCMFTEEEAAVLDKGPDSTEYLKGIGVMSKLAFHPERTQAHAEDIKSMLDCLPDEFKQSGGEGMTFLNMCVDKDGVQWTGLHNVMDKLVCMGVALGFVELTPAHMSKFLPGGVPYVVYYDIPRRVKADS